MEENEYSVGHFYYFYWKFIFFMGRKQIFYWKVYCHAIYSSPGVDFAKYYIGVFVVNKIGRTIKIPKHIFKFKQYLIYWPSLIFHQPTLFESASKILSKGPGAM